MAGRRFCDARVAGVFEAQAGRAGEARFCAFLMSVRMLGCVPHVCTWPVIFPKMTGAQGASPEASLRSSWVGAFPSGRGRRGRAHLPLVSVRVEVRLMAVHLL